MLRAEGLALNLEGFAAERFGLVEGGTVPEKLGQAGERPGRLRVPSAQEPLLHVQGVTQSRLGAGIVAPVV